MDSHTTNTRRRVDWPVILGADQPLPRVLDHSAPLALSPLLASFDALAALENRDQLLRRVVELARQGLGLQRAAVFLFDEGRDLMVGTWGTDLGGGLVDEHHIVYAVSETDREAFRRLETEGAHFTIFEDCPIVEHREERTEVRGRGWVACTPIRSSRATIGMLFNDAGLSGAPFDPMKQEQAAILCTVLGARLESFQRFADMAIGGEPANEPPRQGLAAEAVALLAEEPGLLGKELAARLEVPVGRLGRVFKSAMGISLVHYRNRLRLKRFSELLDGGHRNISKAAQEAGFGSYAQFHRVFRSVRQVAPREYLNRRG